jgi:hypothetical protein
MPTNCSGNSCTQAISCAQSQLCSICPIRCIIQQRLLHGAKRRAHVHSLGVQQYNRGPAALHLAGADAAFKCCCAQSIHQMP